jgi:hypothetical protein
VFMCVCSKFSANQMKHIRTAFLDMDTDRTGTVTIRVCDELIDP